MIQGSRKHLDAFSPIDYRSSFIRDGDVPFQPFKNLQEVGENVTTRDVSIDKALGGLGNISLVNIQAVIGNISKVTRIHGKFLECPSFNKVLVMEEGLPLYFVGLYKPIAIPL